jgi:hypothetical protein
MICHDETGADDYIIKPCKAGENGRFRVEIDS